MTPVLDIRTLSFTAAVIAAILYGYMSHLQVTRKTYQGFRHWTLAALASGTGSVLVTMRGLVPELISVVSANFLIILAIMLVFRGLAIFAGARPRVWPDAGLMVVFIGLICWFTYGQASVNWRIIIFSLCNGYYSLRAARLAAVEVAGLLRARNWQLIVTLAGMGAFFLLRAVLTFLSEQHLADFMDGGTLQVVTFLVSFLVHILIFTGLIFLNIQRLELDLAKAQEELKVLGGLLPICAHCKRIRDDSGYWHQVERYITDHSQASFTHGICPQCLQEIYPEVADKVQPEAAAPEARGA